LKKLSLANQLCSQYVLDSISTGAVIAFAIEAYEKGILTKADTGGIALEYGDADLANRLIPMIARREGIGDLLAEGVSRAARRLGSEAEAFALHVRGQEIPMHEPRGKKSLAIAYATSPTGADHMEAPHDPLYEGFFAGPHPLAPLGLIEPVDMLDFGPKKIRTFTYAQKLWSTYNLVGMCCFVGVPIGKLDTETMVRFMNGVTGWDLSLWELLKAAERSSALFRIYNHREGLATEADGLPQRFSDPDGHWTGFSARARILIYNRNLVPEGQEPRSVMDLLDARFKGKACLANPLFGTTAMHVAALFAVLGQDKAKAFFEGFAANGAKILSSNGEVRRRVAEGEFAVGLTDTDDANVARIEGKPVGVIYPDADGMGILIIPNCTVLIADSPNPDAGRRFIDYLLRPETERALAESEAAQMPLRPGITVPEGAASIERLKPMPVDYATLADLLEGLSKEYLKDWVDRNS